MLSERFVSIFQQTFNALVAAEYGALGRSLCEMSVDGLDQWRTSVLGSCYERAKKVAEDLTR